MGPVRILWIAASVLLAGCIGPVSYDPDQPPEIEHNDLGSDDAEADIEPDAAQEAIAPPTEEELDPASHRARDIHDITFTDSTPLNHAVAHGACLARGDTIWHIGGTDGVSAMSQVQEWRPNGQWQDQVALPAPRSHAVAVIHDNSLLVIGGYDNDGTPSTDVWQEIVFLDGLYAPHVSLEAPLAEASVLRMQDRIALIGGTHDGTTATDQILTIQDDAWRTEGRLAQPRGGAAVAMVADDRFIAVAGWNQTQDVARNDSQEQTLNASLVVDAERLPEPPRNGFASIQFGPHLYVFGGIDPDGNATAFIDALHLATGEWQRLADLPEPRSGMCPVLRPYIHNDTVRVDLHLLGGLDAEGYATDGHWVATLLEAAVVKE